MREIKFRAWDKEEKFMLQDIQSMYDGSCSHKETEERYGWISCFDSFIDNDNYVVMQFTGLKDINGTEIYEGDIVKGATTHKFIVSCENGHTYISYKCSGTKYKDLLFDFYIKDDELEIIGNRWDNPEEV